MSKLPNPAPTQQGQRLENILGTLLLVLEASEATQCEGHTNPLSDLKAKPGIPFHFCTDPAGKK